MKEVSQFTIIDNKMWFNGIPFSKPKEITMKLRDDGKYDCSMTCLARYEDKDVDVKIEFVTSIPTYSSMSFDCFLEVNASGKEELWSIVIPDKDNEE